MKEDEQVNHRKILWASLCLRVFFAISLRLSRIEQDDKKDVNAESGGRKGLKGKRGLH